jgi:hypothetical protein
VGCTPRVNGKSPGRPSSVERSAGTCSGPKTGASGAPQEVVTRRPGV